jgi:hypothetical protein
MNRVLLIHPEGNSFNNPTLKCVIDLLLDEQVNVDVRYFKTFAPMPIQRGILLLPFGRIYRSIKNTIFNNSKFSFFAWVSIWLEWLFIYRKYELIIGVDREGLIEAAMLSRISSTPFVLFSFEIMFECETSHAYKTLERSAGKYVKYWFVQDTLRADHLQLENKLDPVKRVLIPLASTGKGMGSANRLRDRLGIPSNRYVVLAIGSLTAWSMAREILISVSSWPDDWVLIIHERYGRTAEALALIGVSVADLPKNKLYFSDQASVNVDCMDEIMAGVSVGLAFYSPNSNNPYTGNNLKYLGLASGKISTFLRYGIPVIMNDIGMYSTLAKENKFGVVVESPNCIGAMLPFLVEPAMRSAAYEFYKNNLDFLNYKECILAKFNKAASGDKKFRK